MIDGTPVYRYDSVRNKTEAQASGMMPNKNMDRAVWLILLLVIVAIIGSGTALFWVVFTTECSGYLNQAANANTVELASDRLDRALAYAKRQGYKDGDSTRVIIDYPSCDVGYWLRNLQSAKAELAALPDNATPLEKSNMLMKLRESLMEGEYVVVPPMMAWFPLHKFFFCLWIVGGIAAFFAFMKIITAES